MWCHLSIRHADCSIRVIALLEYFDWTLNKQHSRSKVKGRGFSVPLFIHASSLGRLLMLISYLCSIIKGRVSPKLDHYDWYPQMGVVVCIVLIRTKE